MDSNPSSSRYDTSKEYTHISDRLLMKWHLKSDMYSVMERYKNGKTIPTLTTLKDRRDHAAYKKPVAIAYSMTSLTQFEPYLDEMIRVLIRELKERFISEDQDGTRRCDIHNWLQYCMSPSHASAHSRSDH